MHPTGGSALGYTVLLLDAMCRKRELRNSGLPPVTNSNVKTPTFKNQRVGHPKSQTRPGTCILR